MGLLTLAGALVFTLLMNMTVAVYDEGLVLQGAVEVTNGLVPHRDFFWTYGPLQLWILGGLFSVFGKSIVVARLYDACVRTAIVLVCGLTARRLGVRTFVVAGVMLLEIALLYAVGFFLYPVLPCLLCALVGTLLLVGREPGADLPTGMLLLAGAFTGLTALLRYDIGFFLLVGHVASLSFYCFDARRPIGSLIRQVIAYGSGVAILFLPVAVSAWVAGAIPSFLHDIVTFPGANYLRMRSLPWPLPGRTLGSVLPLVSYVPFVASAIGVVWLALTGTRKRAPGNPQPGRKLAVALVFLTVLFIFKGIVRVSLVQSLLALVPALLLLAYLGDKPGSKGVRAAALGALGFSVVLVLLNARSVVRSEESARFDDTLAFRIEDPKEPASPCRGLSTVGLSLPDPDTYRAACYVDAHTGPGHRIFVGAGRHDKLFASNALLYFVSERLPATKWYHLEPGLQTQESVQSAIVHDLDASGVQVVALDQRFDGKSEPNDSAISSNANILDQFLRTHFVYAARFGTIMVLTRRHAG